MHCHLLVPAQPAQPAGPWVNDCLRRKGRYTITSAWGERQPVNDPIGIMRVKSGGVALLLLRHWRGHSLNFADHQYTKRYDGSLSSTG